jgi:hypothetical protein
VMNQLFINIKVDREERPDLDKIYQTAFQMLHRRSGGWPLTMFLTHDDQVPFRRRHLFSQDAPLQHARFRGYFAAGQRYPLSPASRMICASRIRRCWRRCARNGPPPPAMIRFIDRRAAASRTDSDASAASIRPRRLRRRAEISPSGQSGAPAAALDWRRSARRSRPNQTEKAVSVTLRKMAQGGIYDHLGGGFCRYSVDAEWQIPHFEKMLYDNGPLLALYAQAWRDR